ncbi:MAG: hypothetical protein PWP51_862 [Clostridiales bacterium]|jgi:hypothetical protein|nr:hypothetical protein [Clostridiales bacterium]MDN5298309.1 hypothetical protein [Clostridiales bacterium]
MVKGKFSLNSDNNGLLPIIYVKKCAMTVGGTYPTVI